MCPVPACFQRRSIVLGSVRHPSKAEKRSKKGVHRLWFRGWGIDLWFLTYQ